MPRLRSVLETARAMTDRVLVSYSGGKDSAVVLDLCAREFAETQAFFMYYVPNLSFQERQLAWAEHKYSISIIRLPHWDIARLFRQGAYHAPDSTVPRLTIKDIYSYVREQTGIHWIAAGERIADSIVRRAMIVNRGTIDEQRGRIFPVAHWTKAHVLAYVRQKALRLSEEAGRVGYSLTGFDSKMLLVMKQHYPDDFAKLLALYPGAEAGVKWQEFYGDQCKGNKGKPAEQPESVPEV